MTTKVHPRIGDWDVDIFTVAEQSVSPFMYVSTLSGQTDVRHIAETVVDRLSDPEICPVLPEYPIYATSHLEAFVQPGRPVFTGPCAVWFLEFCNGPLLDAPYDLPTLLLGDKFDPEEFATELIATEEWMRAHGIVAGIVKGNFLISMVL